jgi:hypothetical protein
LSLAGVLINKLFTSILVPFSLAVFVIVSFSQPFIISKFQKSEILVFEVIFISETDEIEAKASHLNQKVITLYKSSNDFILLVVYFSVAISKSSLSIQEPLSVIIICLIQPSMISTFI